MFRLSGDYRTVVFHNETSCNSIKYVQIKVLGFLHDKLGFCKIKHPENQASQTQTNRETFCLTIEVFHGELLTVA
ncbi:hypothetical protein OS493_020211 [Desmophyllum pertusum]|uniref:Uncharacterized protein n=1 Tax=Desmophyllum pertusum TaxID=174260 RepID=A0A9W9ZMW1_9CNID|nr:hypothetical protein OS493_020211 [Desmophyllum pertusum]